LTIVLLNVIIRPHSLRHCSAEMLSRVYTKRTELNWSEPAVQFNSVVFCRFVLLFSVNSAAYNFADCCRL